MSEDSLRDGHGLTSMESVDAAYKRCEDPWRSESVVRWRDHTWIRELTRREAD